MRALSPRDQLRPGHFDKLLLVVFILSLPLLNPWIRGDGVGYYAYVRAPLIQHNLDFTRDYQNANESFRENRFDVNGEIRKEYRTSTGHLDNHFTVGPGMLWAPFLLVTHAGVILAQKFGATVAADGFSAPYRYVMAFATGVYGFLGLWLSFRLARRYTAPLWAVIATLAIWWGSSVPVYMYFNPSWSHAHSIFVCALFLWYWDITRGERTTRQWVILALIAGLMLDVYYPNVMLLSVLVIEATEQYAGLLRHHSSPSVKFLSLLGHHAAFVLIVGIVMLPTFITRTIIYGGPFETGYVAFRYFLWWTPAFFEVLFSADHGLVSWTPLLGVAIIGLAWFAFRKPKVGLPFLAGLLAFYFFLCLYPDWAGISSYGNRFFVSMTPLFILGLAYLLERVAALFASRRLAIAVSSAVLSLFVLWNLGMIYQWGIHLIPARGPISFPEAAYNQFHVVPMRLKSSLESYFLRRGEMMHQIERGDVEHLKRNAEP